MSEDTENVDVDLELIAVLERRELFMSPIPEGRLLKKYEARRDRRGLWTARVDYHLGFTRPLPDGRWSRYLLRVSTRVSSTPTGKFRYTTFRRGRILDDVVTNRMVGTSVLDRAQFISWIKENEYLFNE